MAASLAAQTLSFGEITLVTPATTPPSYQVDLILTTAGSTYATAPNQVAGLQFDLNYAPTQLNVAVALSPATSPSFQLNTTCLGTSFTGCTSAATFNPSTTAAMNNGPGQRAIVIGCCSSNQVSNPSTNPVTSNIMADGVVATLTVQPVSGATTTGQTLTLLNLAGTTSGGLNVAAASIPLTIGAGSNDPNATGILNLYPIYLVGGISPATSHVAPGFGSGSLQLADLILELLYQTGAPGYTLPASCGDYFDAMDVYPADTATTRGGNGTIDLNDLILELLRETGAPGYSVDPVRTSRGLTCVGGRTTANERTATPLEVRASLVLGPTEGAGSAQERVPVYLQAGRDLARIGVAFSAGDERSRLQFQSAPGLSPSVTYNSEPGFVSVAFLAGFDARGGDRTLLGYIVGPAGSGANMKVFGTSATGLNDFQVFGVDFSGTVRQ